MSKEMTKEAARNIALQKKQAIASAEKAVAKAKEQLEAAELALKVALKENK
jgi:hypothetical protein